MLAEHNISQQGVDEHSSVGVKWRMFHMSNTMDGTNVVFSGPTHFCAYIPNMLNQQAEVSPNTFQYLFGILHCIYLNHKSF